MRVDGCEVEFADDCSDGVEAGEAAGAALGGLDLAELRAVYATALDELMSQPNEDVNRVGWLRGELVLLQQQRRDLTVRDQAAVAEIRQPWLRLAAARPHI